MDPHSFSCPDVVRVTAFHLDWSVDFANKAICGSVTLTIETLQNAASQLVLDSRDLAIESVSERDGAALAFTVGERDAKFGSPVTVTLPQRSEPVSHVVVQYRTTPASTALQWLSLEQTADRSHPYVFSQCQAIHCRSLVPLQDTPSVKCPYTATVTVPDEITPLMSAVKTSDEVKGGLRTCRFEQTMPVPSYLVAVVAGRLESRELAPHVHVWSEPSVVDKAAYEFAETEKLLKTAEEFCGEYLWKVYDLVILPPSFPYGGMENPCLTFVTPTLLAGDRSALDVVIHEITHSWTGNLVTSRCWADFWLNEGFTMFIERKILGILHGQPTRHLSAIEGWKTLHDTITNHFKPGDPLTALVPDLNGVDPDDAFSSVPYEKGHTFLWYLEELLGGPEAFEPFLRAYLVKFSKASISTDQFKSFLYEHFSAQQEKLDAVDWKAWLHSPGMPPYTPKFDDQLSWVCAELEKQWMAWEEGQDCPCSADDFNVLTSKQVVEFLERLYLQPQPLPLFKLQKMAQLYSMWDKKNCEIRLRWLRMCLKGRWEAALEPSLAFVTEQGRMKFVRPIYRELYRWEGAVRQRAIDHFLATESAMMHVASHTVRHDLCLDQAKETAV